MIVRIFAAFLISINFLFAQNDDLKNKIDNILKSIPKSTKYGLMIYNPLTKDTLYQRNIKESITPASNVKLYTTGVAYSTMGSEYELSTKIFTDDKNIADGSIDGNLYIKGYGNSLFTENDLDTLVNHLLSLGIKKISGKIIGDDTYFDTVYHRNDWIEEESRGNPMAPVSALIINRNRLYLTFRASSKTGGSVTYSASPECPLFTIKNNAITSRRRGSVNISQSFDNQSYVFTITGALRRGTKAKLYSIEIKNPPLYAAYLLQNRLQNTGIIVDSKPWYGVTPANSLELTKKSITLNYLTRIINKNSDNYLAECLFKTLGAYYSEEQGNAFYATQSILSFLKENNIYREGTSIVDGSGLSHFNRVTISSVVELLENIYLDSEIYFDYYNSLSIAGIDGTLRGRLVRTRAFNNFHGKTGTLNGAIAVSGYLTSKDGEDLIVSILFEFNKGSANKYKDIQDRIIALL